jgi:hypothetical protein
MELFYVTWKQAIEAQALAFNFELNSQVLTSSFQRITRSDAIDFGALDEDSQRQVLVEVIRNPRLRTDVHQLNPWLSTGWSRPIDQDVVSHNDAVVRKKYNREAYRQKLLKIYNSVLESVFTHRIDRDVLIESFLDPDYFRIIG